eukprot:9467699-Pyramimonas_sp.AAC.1
MASTWLASASTAAVTVSPRAENSDIVLWSVIAAWPTSTSIAELRIEASSPARRSGRADQRDALGDPLRGGHEDLLVRVGVMHGAPEG